MRPGRARIDHKPFGVEVNPMPQNLETRFSKSGKASAHNQPVGSRSCCEWGRIGWRDRSELGLGTD